MDRNELINAIVQNQRAVNRVLRQYDPEVWMDLNLTIAQVKSLFFIANQGKVNLRMLATALKVTPSNVTGIIDRLADQRLVSRTENSEDRRMFDLELTPKGDRLISNLRERRASQVAAILRELNTTDLETIARGFELLAKAVSQFEAPLAKVR